VDLGKKKSDRAHTMSRRTLEGFRSSSVLVMPVSALGWPAAGITSVMNKGRIIAYRNLTSETSLY